MVPLVGFLPASDERVRGTVAAIERELLRDGFVQRYTQVPGDTVDGLPAGEGAFLACTFWLADNYALMGRRDEAREVFERLLALRNDVGLLSEEYDPRPAGWWATSRRRSAGRAAQHGPAAQRRRHQDLGARRRAGHRRIVRRTRPGAPAGRFLTGRGAFPGGPGSG